MSETTVDARPRAAQQPIWLLGALLGVAAAALVGAALLLGTWNGFALTYLIFIASEPIAALVGGLIIARQPRNPVGWLIVTHAFCFIGGEFCRQYAIYGAQTAPGALPFARAVVWPAYWLWGPGIACGFALLPFFFPNGRLVGPRWRASFWLIVALMATVTTAMAFQISDGEAPGLPNPLGVLPNLSDDPLLGPLFALPWVTSALIGVASLLVRFWRASRDERQQIQWLLYAVTLLLIGNWTLPETGIVAELFLSLSLASIWAAIGVAVLRYRLYNIELIINRTLVYGILTTLVVALYIGTVAYLGALFQFLGVFSAQNGLQLQLLAAGVVAVLFQPLRQRLQRGVNRLLYGERDEPYAVLVQLGRRLEDALAPDRVPALVVETVATTLRLPYVAIALNVERRTQNAEQIPQDAEQPLAAGRTLNAEPLLSPLDAGDSEAVIAEYGNKPSSALRSALCPLLLAYQGEQLGRLLLAPRAPG
ncbi:MAG: hypothetical protein H7Y32_01315, partial [Chloroflexales bacterium]|nr:hypothetical protein [Chloroflexales bacterium]